MIRLKDAAGRWVYDVIMREGKIVQVKYGGNIQRAMLFKEDDPTVYDLVFRGIFVVR